MTKYPKGIAIPIIGRKSKEEMFSYLQEVEIVIMWNRYFVYRNRVKFC